jgi:hypothetical protein
VWRGERGSARGCFRFASDQACLGDRWWYADGPSPHLRCNVESQANQTLETEFPGFRAGFLPAEVCPLATGLRYEAVCRRFRLVALSRWSRAQMPCQQRDPLWSLAGGWESRGNKLRGAGQTAKCGRRPADDRCECSGGPRRRLTLRPILGMGRENAPRHSERVRLHML